MEWHDISPATWQSLTEEVKDSSSPKQFYKCPWLTSSPQGFLDVTDYEEMKKFKKHAAHVMIWSPAKDSDVIIGLFPLKYRIPMQLRFDGKFGFAGGLIDELENFTYKKDNYDEFIAVVREGLVREVREEMRIELGSSPTYVFTSIQREHSYEKSYLQHFFTAKISLDLMETLESKFPEILNEDEVLGITRVPLYLMSNELHGYRGFPRFLTNCFAGNSLEQLLRGCVSEGLLSEDQVRVGYHIASGFMSNSK